MNLQKKKKSNEKYTHKKKVKKDKINTNGIEKREEKV